MWSDRGLFAALVLEALEALLAVDAGSEGRHARDVSLAVWAGVTASAALDGINAAVGPAPDGGLDWGLGEMAPAAWAS